MSALNVSDVVEIVTSLSQAIVTLIRRQTSPEAVTQAIDDIVERAHAIDRDVDLAASGHQTGPTQQSPQPPDGTPGPTGEAPR